MKCPQSAGDVFYDKYLLEKTSFEFPLWVKSGHDMSHEGRPLYTSKQTLLSVGINVR